MKTNQNTHTKNSIGLSKLSGSNQAQYTRSGTIQIPEISLLKDRVFFKHTEAKFEVITSNNSIPFYIPFPIINYYSSDFWHKIFALNKRIRLRRLVLDKVRRIAKLPNKILIFNYL